MDLDPLSVSTAPTAPEDGGTDTSFGAVLRRAREAQGLTLRELAQRTDIRRDSLQALEDTRLADLPEATLARAYLRRIARELALDPAPLLADFDRLSHPEVAQTEHDVPASAGPQEDDSPSPGPLRLALIAVLVALLLAMGTLLLRRPVPATVTPTPTVTPALSSTPPTPPSVSPQGGVRLSVKSVPDGAVVYLDNRNLGPAPVRSFPVDARNRAELRVEAAGRVPLRQTINLSQGRDLRALLPAAVQGSIRQEASVLEDLSTGARTATPQPAFVPVPAAPPPPASATPAAAVRITFADQSWTRVSDSTGRVLYEGTPATGSVRTSPAGVTIRAGNAGAVRVSVQGGPETALGRAGQVVTRTF